MLVLQRFENESVVFDFSQMTAEDLEALRRDGITVSLVQIRDSKKARLGFDAPKSVGVHRYEVFRRIQLDGARRKQAAAL